MEKSKLCTTITPPSELTNIINKIKVHSRMRQLKIPFYIETAPKGGKGILIYAAFNDTTITFKSTSLKTMLQDSKDFIEEVNDKFKLNQNFHKRNI